MSLSTFPQELIRVVKTDIIDIPLFVFPTGHQEVNNFRETLKVVSLHNLRKSTNFTLKKVVELPKTIKESI